MDEKLKDMELVYDPIIRVDTERDTLIIKGREMTDEEHKNFTISLKGYKDNYVRNVIKDQLKWLAINQGIHQCQTTEQLVFAKAALWLIQKEEELINSL
jgi:hypothetical protein